MSRTGKQHAGDDLILQMRKWDVKWNVKLMDFITFHLVNVFMAHLMDALNKQNY